MHNNFKPEWPDGKKFAVCLTHDVDRVKKTHQYFTRSVRFSKKMEIKKAFNEIFYFFKFYFLKDSIKDPYWTFEIIMDIERKAGVRSTFYFLNEKGKINILKPGTWKLYSGRYDIKEANIVNIIKKLDNEGWEIGLHGSYRSYENKDLLKLEKEELENIVGKRIPGVRQHYGNLKIPSTWKIQEELGFEYDSSYGIINSSEFKDNKYFPFYPLGSKFMEIPLAIMDHQYHQLFEKNKEDVWEICEKIIEDVEKSNGVLNVLWHNDVFREKVFPGRCEVYEKIIKLCQQKNAWITNVYEIAKWWDSKRVSNY
jgi:peptidoglycan/xylan/chitin deacetylase (PgdA/CDA1 family)